MTLSKDYPTTGPGRYCPNCGKFTKKVVMRNPRISFFLTAFQDGETYHCSLCDITFRVTVAPADNFRHKKSYTFRDGKQITLPEENLIDGRRKE